MHGNQSLQLLISFVSRCTPVDGWLVTKSSFSSTAAHEESPAAGEKELTRGCDFFLVFQALRLNKLRTLKRHDPVCGALERGGGGPSPLINRRCNPPHVVQQCGITPKRSRATPRHTEKWNSGPSVSWRARKEAGITIHATCLSPGWFHYRDLVGKGKEDENRDKIGGKKSVLLMRKSYTIQVEIWTEEKGVRWSENNSWKYSYGGWRPVWNPINQSINQGSLISPNQAINQ